MSTPEDVNRKVMEKVMVLLEKSTPGNSWGSLSNALFFGVLAVANILAGPYWIAYLVAVVIPAGSFIGVLSWRKGSELRDLVDKTYRTSVRLPVVGEVICFGIVAGLAAQSGVWVPMVLDLACMGIHLWNRQQALRRMGE